MATRKQVLRVYEKVKNAENALSAALTELSGIVSEYAGYELSADLCHGSEVEFRKVCADGLSDNESTILLEEIINPE